MPETVVRFDDRRPIPAAVFIGNENDNLVESVEFELAEWLSEAIVYIYLTANDKSDVVNIGTNRVFDVTRTHTHEAGRWEAYLEAYLNGDRVWHSDEFAMYVGALPAIGNQIEQQYPTAIEDALRAAEMLTGLRARAETLPEGSEPTVRFDEEAGEIVYGLPLGPKGDAGFSPTIRTTTVSGGYEISITNSDGSTSVFTVKNGTSPTVRVSKIDGGNRVTITDASGPKTFDVMDGKDGDKVTAETVNAALGYTPASEARVSVLEQDMAEVKKITDNFELFVPKFVNEAEGETIVLTDSAEGTLQGLKVYGRTTQDGTPTPDAPVPLVSVGDDGAVEVTVAGANLIPYPYENSSITSHGITYTVNADGSVGIKGTATQAGQLVLVATGTTFASLGIYDTVTLSCVTRGTLGFVFSDGTSINVDPSTPSVTIAPNGKTFRIRWLSKAGVTYDETIYPMLNMGDVALPWEPYKPAQTLTILTTNGLPSVGDVCDEIDLERGVYAQRIGRIASYAGESVGNEWMSTTGDLTTGATIIYQLVNPIETPLSAEEIAAYKAMKTHYPTTTIYNDESARMSVKYAADTKNYIDQKLATLAAAMVNNL